MKCPSRSNLHDGQIRLADSIARIFGSMGFIYGFTAGSILWLTVLERQPFGVFTMALSLLAIYLTAFVLISQNRQTELDRQASASQTQSLLNQTEILKAEQVMSEILRNHLKDQDGELDILRENLLEHRKNTQEDQQSAEDEREQIIESIESVREEARRVQRELKAFKKSHDEN